MKLYKVEAFIPESHLEEVIDALNIVGALTIGGPYDYCVFRTRGVGSWRPLEGARPYEGTIGEVSKVEEIKIEFTCKDEVIKEAIQTIEEKHPYEGVVINVIPVLVAKDFV